MDEIDISEREYEKMNEQINEVKVKQKVTTYQMALISLMTAITCILGPISIQLPGGVPISLTNLVIYLTVFVLGCKKGTISYCIYMFLGIIGLPVFSGFAGGVGKVAGPTGGYILGFIFLAMISGYFIEKFPGKNYIGVIGMVLGTVVAYILGTVWFIVQTHMALGAALVACVFPFLIGDIIKIAIATLVGPIIRKQLLRAGLNR